VLFGFALTILSSSRRRSGGRRAGLFRRPRRLFFQRFIEIWTAIPSLYLLLIISSISSPASGCYSASAALLLGRAGRRGRAEFLRARNFEYVKAAPGASASAT
jgi:microcin C transport system permease protein